MSRALPLAGAPPPPAPGVPAWAVKGFRPFFLLAAVFAALIVPIWLLALAGVVHPEGYLEPMIWHAHEMVFGYAVAVIAGFLLTAVATWTARETASGAPLIGLATLWLLGRGAFALAGVLPPVVVAAIDLAFLPALAVVIGRPIVATRNRRNYPVLGVIVALWLADLAIHLDVLGVLPGWRWRATIGAVELVTLLVLFVAARVVPMFTRNATKVAAIRNLPALDWATVVAMALLVVVDLARPGHVAGAVLAGATAVLALARSLTWGARHTARHPLLWILHLGHGWIVVGLGLRAASALTEAIPLSTWMHALTVGAIGCTTLGMMARVALGHTGRPLVVRGWITLAFAALTVAAIVRVLGPCWPATYQPALHASGALWALAFAIFVVTDAGILGSPRPDGQPG
jgi:uncharacterized protein involved in response to NO